MQKTNFRINETIFTLQTFVRLIEAKIKTVKNSLKIATMLDNKVQLSNTHGNNSQILKTINKTLKQFFF